MAPASGSDLNEAGSSDELKGLSILVVEDSWLVGKAMQELLELRGADVAGPAATTAEAERLVGERTPDIAIVDFSLREGERADGLIERLHDRGVHVILISGYTSPPMPPGKVAATLQKPISEARLLASLRPLAARKAAR
jgi:DNA-binding NtrC family response regulator